MGVAAFSLIRTWRHVCGRKLLGQVLGSAFSPSRWQLGSAATLRLFQLFPFQASRVFFSGRFSGLRPGWWDTISTKGIQAIRNSAAWQSTIEKAQFRGTRP